MCDTQRKTSARLTLLHSNLLVFIISSRGDLSVYRTLPVPGGQLSLFRFALLARSQHSSNLPIAREQCVPAPHNRTRFSAHHQNFFVLPPRQSSTLSVSVCHHSRPSTSHLLATTAATLNIAWFIGRDGEQPVVSVHPTKSTTTHVIIIVEASTTSSSSTCRLSRTNGSFPGSPRTLGAVEPPPRDPLHGHALRLAHLRQSVAYVLRISRDASSACSD